MIIHKCDICNREIIDNFDHIICTVQEIGQIKAYGYDMCRKCGKKLLKNIKEMKKDESR